jgi:hypothetical protein
LTKGTVIGRIWSFGVGGCEEFVPGFSELGGSGRSIFVAAVELGAVGDWFCGTCIAGWGLVSGVFMLRVGSMEGRNTQRFSTPIFWN